MRAVLMFAGGLIGYKFLEFIDDYYTKRIPAESREIHKRLNEIRELAQTVMELQLPPRGDEFEKLIVWEKRKANFDKKNHWIIHNSNVLKEALSDLLPLRDSRGIVKFPNLWNTSLTLYACSKDVRGACDHILERSLGLNHEMYYLLKHYTPEDFTKEEYIPFEDPLKQLCSQLNKIGDMVLKCRNNSICEKQLIAEDLSDVKKKLSAQKEQRNEILTKLQNENQAIYEKLWLAKECSHHSIRAYEDSVHREYSARVDAIVMAEEQARALKNIYKTYAKVLEKC